MRYINLLVVAVALACSGGRVSAAPEDSSFYVNGSYLINTTAETGAGDVDFEGNNGQAAYLGYRFTPMLSLEIGGAYFQSIDSRDVFSGVTQETEHDLSLYSLGVRGTTSFAGLFDIWGGIGLHTWESTFNYRITYQNFPGLVRTGHNSNSGDDMYYRVGVTLPLTDHFRATIESAYFEMNDFFSNVEAGDNADFEHRYIGLGFEYNF